jgi:hypothetical protein
MAMTQQETGELLARLTQGANCGQTRSNQIADRLVRLIRNPDGGQFTGSMQFGKIDRIPPVGLDPVTGPTRDQRSSNDNACVLSNRITSRSRAKPLMTAGSQSSIVPRKRWQKTIGALPGLPNRR